MMKILIVSDTHRKDKNLERVIEREKPLDMFIHLGDAEGSEYAIASWVNPSCVMEMVSGNNDFFSRLDREQDFMLGRYRVLLTHGHYYSVSVGTEYLRQEARARGFDIVMFGHTHKPYLEYCSDGLVVLNPGSLSYPRQDGRHPSFMIMEIDRFGEAHYTTNFL